eukprot:gene20165-22140_t
MARFVADIFVFELSLFACKLFPEANFRAEGKISKRVHGFYSSFLKHVLLRKSILYSQVIHEILDRKNVLFEVLNRKSSCRILITGFELSLHNILKSLKQINKWSAWNNWTACSRSCGGGISYQIRSCLNSTDGVGRSCVGPKRRNRMCNIQDCPEKSKDFRSVQCAAFNSKKYKGKHFKWVPWPQAAFPCELSCMPKGQRFYVRLATKVKDGTKCHTGSLDTCIDGKCESVGCDLVLNSNAKFDNCRECNGKNTLCKPVRGNFVLKDFEPDYVEMVIIPARSTTIFIKEEGRLRNYIAVKDYNGNYIFNGDWIINNPGQYRLNGHYANYVRSSRGQSLTIDGPIDAPITVEILAYSKPVNFTYEYYVPNGENNGILKTTYGWSITNRRACSSSCAGGIRKRTVECVSSNKETVSDFLCDKSKKPEDIETCNTQPCPARWFTGEWSSCSKSCGTGERVRRVHCIRQVQNNDVEMLPHSDCHGKEPAKVEYCTVKKVCPIWKAAQWSECSKSCGPGFKVRNVNCVGKTDYKSNVLDETMCDETIKPSIRESCDLGSCNLTWVIGSWSECSAHCGVGMRNREITCQNSKKRIFPDGFCDKTFKPQPTEDCLVSGPCLPTWYATQWSRCSRNCGNGIQMRMVYCGSKEGKSIHIVPDSNCKVNERPVKMKNCHQLKPCIIQYFASSWRPCSASCNGGLRFRKVRCYADTRIDYTEKSCRNLKKPAGVEICNRQSCESESDKLVRGPISKSVSSVIKTTREVPIQRTTKPQTTTVEATTRIATTVKVTEKPTTIQHVTTNEPTTQPATQRSIPAIVINFQGPESTEEGEPADFYCNAGGKPSPEITWKLNGKAVRGLGSRFLLLNGDTHLLITKTAASDSGSISCTARNQGGSDVKSLNLQVSSVPKVTVTPSNADLKEGDSFFMTCQVVAYPTAQISWRKDGRPFYGDRNSGRVQVTKTVVRFTKLLPADSGRYECHAENSAGASQTSMTLRVKAETKPESCVDDNELANCQIIKKFNLCGHNFYGQVCCQTCSGKK